MQSANSQQVIGTAIAINLIIPKIPLWGGCLISVTDTLFILLFYNADGTLRRLRVFEGFVAIFIIGVFVSFCIELSLIEADVGEVFKGYLPSREVFVGNGYVSSLPSYLPSSNPLTHHANSTQTIPILRNPRRHPHAPQPLPRQRPRPKTHARLR